MSATSTAYLLVNMLDKVKDQATKQALAFIWGAVKAIWPAVWPYVLGGSVIVIAGIVLQILMLRDGDHDTLSPWFNRLVCSLTNTAIFGLLLFIAYQIWGTQVIDELWFALIEAIAFPLTWIFLRLIGFWYH